MAYVYNMHGLCVTYVCLQRSHTAVHPERKRGALHCRKLKQPQHSAGGAASARVDLCTRLEI